MYRQASRNTGLILLIALSLALPGVAAVARSTSVKPKPAKPGTARVAPASASASKTSQKTSKATPAKTASKSVAAKPATPKSGSRTRRVYRGPWREPSYADSTASDNIEGEDLVVRRAAVEALGPYNGTVVVVDPHTGRVLTMVNQKLALKTGFQPCSTIKIVCAMAALSEGLIERNSMVRLYGRTTMNLTEALARSNNPYFANLGTKLGFDRVRYYARLYGLGEPAGLNIEGESPGSLAEIAPKYGGVGMMTSFGEGVSLTVLQLASLMGAVANGGTLYYLQYPRSSEEAANLVPRVKRHLDIQQLANDVKPGMMAAVEYGTARRAAYDPNEPIYGKTGTCTDRATPTHLGWFGSFNDTGRSKLAVVVLLTGGRQVNGPVASGVAGDVYRLLSRQNYFAHARPTSPVALVSGPTFSEQ